MTWCDEFIIDGKPRISIFNTSTEYYQFIVKMKNQSPETDENQWLNDERARFAYNQGYEDGRLFDKEHTIYIENRLMTEEKKRNKLVELLRGKGVIVDASGDDVRIDRY